MNTRPAYVRLDAAILKEIAQKEGIQFPSICAGVSSVSENFARDGAKAAWRIVAARLQALRKAGRIRYQSRPAGWFLARESWVVQLQQGDAFVSTSEGYPSQEKAQSAAVRAHKSKLHVHCVRVARKAGDGELADVLEADLIPGKRVLWRAVNPSTGLSSSASAENQIPFPASCAADLDAALGLETISLRLPAKSLHGLEREADAAGVALQTLLRNVLQAYAVQALERSGAHILTLEIIAERARQDARWGGPEHDDQHGLEDFVGFINARTSELARGFESAEVARKRMIQIAALAVAAVESMDRKTENRNQTNPPLIRNKEAQP